MSNINVNKTCQNCKDSFVIEPDDFGFYGKVGVPAPTFCPPCRMQRRFAWSNRIFLFNRTCGLCNKSVVSLYAPDSGITVYCNKCWWSDKWDPMDYGVDYDFSKPFFTQYAEFIRRIPHIATVNDDGIASLNCEYTNDWWFAKNCYMCFSGWRIENVMYSLFILAGKDIMDSFLNMSETEFIYECVNCTHGHRVKYSEFSRACINSEFLYDCQNCSDCFMCTGLRNKKYHFKNQEYSKEEYQKIKDSYRLDTFAGVESARKEYEEFILDYPRRFAWVKQNVNSNGDIVSYSKNTKQCFIGRECENTKYGDYVTYNKESYDMSMSGELSECYECMVGDHSQMNLFGIFSVKSQDVRYTQHCHSSKHLFACSQLRNASYCIFNKKYSKEEYEEIVGKIIEQMNAMPYVDKNGCEYRYGEFYPAELSVFGYNETIAPEQFPLSRDEALARGYKWQDNMQRTVGRETIKPEEIPEAIGDVPDSITSDILACIGCNRNYKIMQNELIFYKKLQIPIPRRCFYCRHNARLKKINPFKLYKRTCMCTEGHSHGVEKCNVEFETSYALERPEIVYCEKCYQQEVN